MGVDRVIRFSNDSLPSWNVISDGLSARGMNPILRMIDGLPAFPNEVPSNDWRELRVGLSGGMVTLRKEERAIRCVIWGSHDPTLIQSWHECVSAIIEAGQGATEDPPPPENG